MASVFNRTTKEFRGSVNTPDFDPADWIINPDVSAVAGAPTKYWIIDPPASDTLRLATAGEQLIIDNQIASDQEAADKDGAKTQTDTDRRLLGFMQVMVDEINILRLDAGIPPARDIDDYKNATKNNIDAGAGVP
jgi:hypothetical protein